MNVAVTGAGGAIGSYVCRELSDHGHEVTAVGRGAPLNLGTRFAVAAIDDATALERAFGGADAVVHLAAITSPYRAAVQDLLAVNVLGTACVLEAAVAADVPKLVFASSGAATGFSFQRTDRRPRYLPLDEDHPSEPDDSYGLSKLVGETMCARWSRAFPMATICLRINHNWCVDRAGAEQAVAGGGWAKGLAVTDLWERYRLQLDRAERPRSSDSPPPPRDILWAVTDARDCAQAFRLAVENETVRHDVFLINGFDTCSHTASAELAAQHFSDTPLRRPLSGHDTLVSHRRATELLGYVPRHTWRESDFASWYWQSARRQPRRAPT